MKTVVRPFFCWLIFGEFCGKLCSSLKKSERDVHIDKIWQKSSAY